MNEVGGAGRQVRAAVLATIVFLVLLGVVGMHHVGGGEHESHAATPGLAAGLAAGHVAGHAAAVPARAGSLAARAASSARHAPFSVPDERHWSAGHVPSAAVPACLAVLAGLAVLLLPVVRRTTRPSHLPGSRLLASSSSTPPGRGPPRALLAQLCVLRT